MSPSVQQRRLGTELPTTVEGLYREIEELLWSFHPDPPDPQELTWDAQALKRELLELVEGLTERPSLQDAPGLTLAALSRGMLAGALDGTLLFCCGQTAEQPEFRPRRTYLQHPTGVLRRNLAQVLEVGRTNWALAEANDLQLLSGYGKHQNRDSLEEARELLGTHGVGFPDFQEFLLASFKGGYAMGVADAAVVFVGGEKPGAPPA